MLFSFGISAIQAGEPAHKDFSKSVVSEFPFEKGDWEFQALGGAYFGLEDGTKKRPNIGDAGANFRLGRMLNSPAGSSWFRGNYELLLEAFASGVFQNSNGVFSGATLIARRNFVQPNARLVPYFQIGAGGLYNDVYKDKTQRVIGSEFEFNLQGSLGLRFMLTDKCALVLEGGYRHISNADTAARNLGLNSVGGLVGVSCFF